MKILSFVLGMVLGLSLVSAFASADEAPRNKVLCHSREDNLNDLLGMQERLGYTIVSAPSFGVIQNFSAICVTVSKPPLKTDGPAERPACQPAR